MRPYTEVPTSRGFNWAEVLILIAAALLIVAIAGCDSAEFEHQRQVAEFNAKVTRMCIPEPDSFVTVKWEDYDLVIRHYKKEAGKLSMTKTIVEPQ